MTAVLKSKDREQERVRRRLHEQRPRGSQACPALQGKITMSNTRQAYTNKTIKPFGNSALSSTQPCKMPAASHLRKQSALSPRGRNSLMIYQWRRLRELLA
jgi:hypothetical protein